MDNRDHLFFKCGFSTMVKNHGMDKIFTCSTIGERSLRAKNLGLELSIRASLGLPALNVWLTS